MRTIHGPTNTGSLPPELKKRKKMKLNIILGKPAAAMAALALTVAAAHAATLQNGTDGAGELFIGFRTTSNVVSTNIVLDAGDVAALSAFAAGSPAITLGNLGADLVAAYGANWFNRTDLLWAAVAAVGNTPTADPTNTLYGGVAADGIFPLATAPYTRTANGSQGSVATQILSMAASTQGFTAAPTGASSNIAVENTADINSWSSKFPPNTASPFGDFSLPSGQQFDQAFAAGTVASGAEGAIDVYRMFKNGIADGDNGNATSGPGSYQFTLAINSAGVVTANFLPVAVPEPASIATLTSAALLAIGASRRRRAALA